MSHQYLEISHGCIYTTEINKQYKRKGLICYLTKFKTVGESEGENVDED